MKRLSSTTLPLTTPQEHVHVSVSNDKYLAITLTNASIYVLNSLTGALLQKTPLSLKEHDGNDLSRSLIGGIVLNGDQVVVCGGGRTEIVVYDIPTE